MCTFIYSSNQDMLLHLGQEKTLSTAPAIPIIEPWTGERIRPEDLDKCGHCTGDSTEMRK